MQEKLSRVLTVGSISEIPINLSFYVYIIPKETNIFASNSNKKKENDHWLNFENWPLKIYIS
jgi:hypothetical protein